MVEWEPGGVLLGCISFCYYDGIMDDHSITSIVGRGKPPPRGANSCEVVWMATPDPHMLNSFISSVDLAGSRI